MNSKKIVFLFFIAVFSYVNGQTTTVKLIVKVPAVGMKSNSSVFLAGSFNGWQPGDSLYMMNKVSENVFSLVMPVFDGKKYEYKYTLGNWNTSEVQPGGQETANRKFISREGLVVNDEVICWRSGLSSGAKDSSLKVSDNQLKELAILKEEMEKKVQGRLNGAQNLLGKTMESLLVEKPDEKQMQKSLAELKDVVGFALELAFQTMLKVSNVLTIEQKNAMKEELKKPNAPQDIFDLMNKTLIIPKK